MNYEEFKKERDELQKKLNEAVDLYGIKTMLAHLTIMQDPKDMIHGDYQISWESKDAQPKCLLNCSKVQLAFVISQLMDLEGGFMDMLPKVIAVYEFSKHTLRKEETMITAENKEQLDLMKKLADLSPEEIEKLKEKIKNENNS